MNILILSGDKTNYYLYKQLLKEGYSVQLEGFHHLKKSDYKPIRWSGYKTIICPIPFSIDGTTLYAPYSEEVIHIDSFLKKCDKDSTIIGGPFPFEDPRLIDITRDKSFREQILTPTVEEIIKIIIDESDYTIKNRSILLTGSGALSHPLKEILGLLGANTTVALNEAEIIINTSNSYSLSNEELMNLKHSWILDVSSTGMKVDNKYAKSLGLKIKRARGLAGKSAPASVATYLSRILAEEGYIKK